MDNLIEKIINIGEKNNFEVEVYVEKSKSLSADLDGDSLDCVDLSDSFGIGVRVLKNGKVGFAYSKYENENIIYKAMENLIDDKYTTLSEKSLNYPNPKGIYFKELENIEENEIIEDLISLKSILEENNITTTGGGISCSYGLVKIVNTNELNIEENFSSYSCSISGIKDGETAYDYLTKNNKFPVEQIAYNTVDLLSIKNKTKQNFEGNIIISPRALGSLLAYTLKPSFNSENIQRNRSILKDKIGEEIFGENITIIDDGTIDNGLYSSKCDDEGVPSQRTVLVKNGVLENYLYDLKRANIDNVNSTGNGSRGSSSLPSVSTTNIIINPVDDINNYNNFVVINTLIGCHTSNPITGDFSVEISNSYIDNNGNKTLLKKGMLSGNIFEILKTALPLNNVEQRGGLIAPPLLINGKIISE